MVTARIEPCIINNRTRMRLGWTFMFLVFLSILNLTWHHCSLECRFRGLFIQSIPNVVECLLLSTVEFGFNFKNTNFQRNWCRGIYD